MPHLYRTEQSSKHLRALTSRAVRVVCTQYVRRVFDPCDAPASGKQGAGVAAQLPSYMLYVVKPFQHRSGVCGPHAPGGVSACRQARWTGAGRRR